MPKGIKESYLTYVYTSDIEKARVKTIIADAIGERLGKLANEKLSIQYYIDGYGVIKEINFILNDDSKILPEDLRRIEEALKKKYIFKVDSLKLDGVDFIPFFWPVRL